MEKHKNVIHVQVKISKVPCQLIFKGHVTRRRQDNEYTCLFRRYKSSELLNLPENETTTFPTSSLT